MEISDVRSYTLSVPLKKPWKTAALLMKEMTATIVEVETKDGLIGYGEAVTRLCPTATREIINDILKPVLIGSDPMEVDVLWERMFLTTKSLGHWKGFMIEAISGVDIALWDLMGKELNQPVYRLLGGCHQRRLEAYASSIMLMEEHEMVNVAMDLVSKGFRKVKVKTGIGVERDISNIRAIRDAVGPDIGIFVDANCRYTLAQALRFGKLLEPLDVLWYEEPVPPYDLEGYERLNHELAIPVVGGETEFSRWGFRDFILRGKAPIIQPDIGRCGGFTEGRKIAALASAHNITVAPHTGASAAVLIAATLQFSASLSNFQIYEHMFPENPLRENILKKSVLECKEGFIHVPEGPGLGIEIDPSKLKRYIRS